MVPIYLDALLLEHDQMVVEATADFARLPYAAPGQDASSDVANLSEEIVSRPFDNQNLNLRAGIHLHWALPDALTRATDSPNETTFPTVPNRWLVTRGRLGGDGRATVENAWIVESDFVYPNGAGETLGSISIPYTPAPDAGHYRPGLIQSPSQQILDVRSDALAPAEDGARLLVNRLDRRPTHPSLSVRTRRSRPLRRP
jgi:hypothetical protein